MITLAVLIFLILYFAIGYGFLILAYAFIEDPPFEGEQFILIGGWPVVLIGVGVYKGCRFLDKQARLLGKKAKEMRDEQSSDS